MWMKINQAWSQLAQREKQLVTVLMSFLAIVLFYSLIWSPIHIANEHMKQALENAKNEWVWLNQQAPLVTQSSTKNLPLDIQSKAGLMRFVQEELKSGNLMHQMQELKLTAKGVKVSFNKVNAPRLFRWLSRLESQGVMAKNMQLIPIEVGLIQAQVEFEVAR
ncbi:type II secretion system protein GspM [Thiomicrorhabdus arctica]|jgi:general secretion pathway protein M|uniref:type II secretion system protein GspM n=1 Tax=Thiomicrorhabdus arctica TaxID=131540 RepID=UPI00037B9373|nr:type II secretion system protein GspM [Thiomicrorhabdus arctica]